jgi:hypothetical protein
VKYIYFELNHYTGEEETIENMNILLMKPETNSEGIWGITHITETFRTKTRDHFGVEKKTFRVVNQHWVDLEKYRTKSFHLGKKDSKIIEEVINKLKEQYEQKENNKD